MAFPIGEAKLEPPRVDHDRPLKLVCHGSEISSDGGLLPYRELAHRPELTELGGEVLSPTRRGKNSRRLLVGLVRQALFGRLAEVADVNDGERLSHDPVMRAIVDRTGLGRRAASSSRMGGFETDWLTTESNLAAPGESSGVRTDRVHDRRPPRPIILDMGRSAGPSHGDREGSAYDGHHGVTLAARALTLCSASTISAILNGTPHVPATCLAPMTGARCWSRSPADSAS